MKEVNCVLCNTPIKDRDEQRWALTDSNHEGVLGPCHEECYDKLCETSWSDPITGEVEYEAMAEDLDVDTGEEDEEDY